jgi:hypothetical protein
MYKGVQQTANKLGLLNAEEYAVIKNEMFAFGGQAMLLQIPPSVKEQTGKTLFFKQPQ